MSTNRTTISSLIYLLNEATGRDWTAKKALIAEWVLEAERKIASGKSFDKVKNFTIDVQHYRGKLPPDCYGVTEVNYCVLSNQCTCNSTPCTCSTCSCGSTDANHTVLSNGVAQRPYCSCGSFYYNTAAEDFHIEGCFIILPYKSGQVTIDYNSLPVDEQGMLLILESHRDAVMNYCIYQYLQGQFYVGRIKGDMLSIARNRWFELCGIARAADMLPSRQRLAFAAEINNDPWKLSPNRRR